MVHVARPRSTTILALLISYCTYAAILTKFQQLSSCSMLPKGLPRVKDKRAALTKSSAYEFYNHATLVFRASWVLRRPKPNLEPYPITLTLTLTPNKILSHLLPKTITRGLWSEKFEQMGDHVTNSVLRL